jgi:hypothetical protein
MPEITYRDIEPVTRELINMTVARQDPYGLVRLRHLDAMYQAIAHRPVATTQESVRADIDDAVGCFDSGSDEGSEAGEGVPTLPTIGGGSAEERDGRLGRAE